MTPDALTVRNHLVGVAKQRRTVTYSEVAKLIKRAAIAMGPVLEEVGWDEWTHDRPMLTSLVIRKGEGTPGPGFYQLANRLGHGPIDRDSAHDFWRAECKKVYEYWYLKPWN